MTSENATKKACSRSTKGQEHSGEFSKLVASLLETAGFIYYSIDSKGKLTLSDEKIFKPRQDEKEVLFKDLHVFPPDFQHVISHQRSQQIIQVYSLLNTNIGRGWFRNLIHSSENNLIEGLLTDVTEDFEKNHQAFLITREIETENGKEELKVVYSNQKARKLLGLRVGPFNELSPWDLVVEEDNESLQTNYQKFLKSKTKTDSPQADFLRPWRSRAVNKRISIEFQKWDYMPAGTKWLINDATDQAKAQQEVEMLADSLSQMTDGVCIYNMKEKNIDWANHRFREIFAIGQNHPLPKILELFPEEAKSLINEKIRIRKQNVMEYDYYEIKAQKLDRNKTPFYIEISSTRKANTNQAIFSVRDVTHKKLVDRIDSNLDDIEKTYDNIFNAIDHLLQSRLMLLYYFNEDNNTLCLRKSKYLDLKYYEDIDNLYFKPTKEEIQLIDELADNTKTKHCNFSEYPSQKPFEPFTRNYLNKKSHSLVVFPIRIGKETVGALYTITDLQPSQNPEISFRLEQLVSISSRAIENALTIRTNLVRDQIVQDIVYREGMESDEFFKKLVNSVNKQINAGAVTIFTEDGDWCLHFKASTVSVIGNASYSFGVGITGLIADQRKPITVPDLRKDGRVKGNVNEFSPINTISFLGVPIRSETRDVIGVLRCVNNYLHVDGYPKPVVCFGFEEIYILKSIADGIRSFIVTYRAEQLRRRAYLLTSHEFAAPPIQILNAKRALQVNMQTSKGSVEDNLALLDDIDALANYVISISDGLKILRQDPSVLADSRCYLHEDIFEPAVRVVKKMYESHKPRISVAQHPERVYSLNKGQMIAAVTNLIINGIKYKKPNEEQARIFIDYYLSEDRRLYIRFTDYGVGIEPKENDKIFDMEFRNTKTSKTVMGSGLGLSVVKAVFKAHGGDIEVIQFKDPTIFRGYIPAERFVS